MTFDPGLADPDELAGVQAAGSRTGVTAAPETQVLWSAREGQIVNAGVFAVAVLFCWLLGPVFWAIVRFLKVRNHEYVLTDQRLLERSGIIVKKMETLELYRVKDQSTSSTLLQTLVGRGQVILQTTDATTPTVLINAVPNPEHVSHIIRERVEACRLAKGVRAFDY